MDALLGRMGESGNHRKYRERQAIDMTSWAMNAAAGESIVWREEYHRWRGRKRSNGEAKISKSWRKTERKSKEQHARDSNISKKITEISAYGHQQPAATPAYQALRALCSAWRRRATIRPRRSRTARKWHLRRAARYRGRPERSRMTAANVPHCAHNSMVS